MADDNKDSDVNTETAMETSADETSQDAEMQSTVEMAVTKSSEGTPGGGVVAATGPAAGTVAPLGKPTGLCYCGRGRSVREVELQCSVCLKWFHKECISSNVGNMLPFMTTYHFCCKYCHPNNQEVYSRKMPNFSQLCHMALANLMSQNPAKSMFSKEKELIPFIDGNWESLTPMQRRTTVTWHQTIVKAMLKDSDLFVQKEKPDNPTEDESDYPMFGLVDKDLSNISPNYDPSKQATNVSSVTTPQTVASSNGKGSNGNNTNVSISRKRGPKKRDRDIEGAIVVSTSKRSKSDMMVTPKLPPHGFPLEHPFNKDGYRYVLTETDPQVQSAAYDDDFWIGKPIPAHLYRAVVGTQVLLAPQDKRYDAFIIIKVKIADNRLTATGEKGYCMVRATHGTNRGSWYFEVKLDSLPEGSATRLGWSQALGNLQAPLGYDKFSYSWRSRKGTRFHQSRGKHYSDAYKEGDVLGFYMKLPDSVEPAKILPETYKDSTLIKFKSHLYFEEKDEPSQTEKTLKPKENTQIIFFKNGKNQGVAFDNLFAGTYFPAMSLYKGCTVTANFGPKFKHPPKDVKGWQPISDLAEQAQVEQTLSDLIYHIEHEDEYRNYEMGLYP